MKLENQVCSLENAKKLKELGVKQDSLWGRNKNIGGKEYHLARMYNAEISAFTIAELMERLPAYIDYEKMKCILTCWKKPDEFGVIYNSGLNNAMNPRIDKTLANALAKMLIYLIENKLIKEEKNE